MGNSRYVGKGQSLSVISDPATILRENPLETTTQPQQSEPQKSQTAEKQVGAKKRKTVTTEEVVVMPGGDTHGANGATNGSHGKIASLLPTIPENPCAALINAMAMNPSAYAGVRIKIQQLSPKTFELDKETPVGLTVGDIKHWLGSNYGSGVYLLTLERDGAEIEGPQGKLTLRDVRAPNDEGGLQILDEDPVKRAKAQTQLKGEEKRQAEIELEQRRIELSKAKLDSEAKREADKEKSDPVMAIIAELKKEKESLERKLETAAHTKPADSLTDQLVKLTPVLALLMPLLKREPDTGVADALKEIARSSEKNAERQERAQEKNIEAMRLMNEKVLETLKDSKKTTGGLAEMITTIRSIRELGDEFGPARDRDELDIDPNNIWGSLAVTTIKGIHSLFKNGSPVIQKAIEDATKNINRTPETLTEDDQGALDREIERQMLIQNKVRQKQRALAAGPTARAAKPQAASASKEPPAALPLLEAPQRFEIASNPPEPYLFPQNEEEEVSEPVLENQETDSPTQSQPETPAPAAAEPEIPTVATEPLPELSEIMLDDAVKEVEATTQTMAQDILSGRVFSADTNAPMRWIEEALDIWPEPYKDKLLELGANSYLAIVRDVKEKAGTEWDKVLEALYHEGNKRDAIKPRDGQYVYNNFHASFQTFIAAWKVRKAELAGGMPARAEQSQ